MSALDQFNVELAGLIARSGPAATRRLAAQLGRDLRKVNQDRIKSQINPDGSAYAPRAKGNARRQRGKIKRAMFSKLRLARHLRVTTTATGAELEFAARAAVIAKSHHYGQSTDSSRLPVRELLGMTATDIDLLKSKIMSHLAGER